MGRGNPLCKVNEETLTLLTFAKLPKRECKVSSQVCHAGWKKSGKGSTPQLASSERQLVSALYYENKTMAWSEHSPVNIIISMTTNCTINPANNIISAHIWLPGELGKKQLSITVFNIIDKRHR